MTTETETKATMRLYTEGQWPDSLKLVPVSSRPVMPSQLANHVIRHNYCVTIFSSRPANLNGPERAILRLAEGINAWITLRDAEARTDYGRQDVTYPLLTAFKSALNLDCGRLDAGTLSDWADATLRSLGINPDGGARL
jgi:hypothetical protein